MRVFVSVDENGGVAFNKRRQSRDKVLYEKILEIVGKGVLYLSPYSEKLFVPSKSLKVTEDYLKLAEEDDYCFAEREELEGFEDKISKLYLVKWNRVYPNDSVLKLDLSYFSLKECFEFEGKSHDRITVEIYEKIR